MLKAFSNWKGAIEINGTRFDRYEDIPSDLIFTNDMNILLLGSEKSSADTEANVSCAEYVVTVRQYMTKKATPEFDFMLKLNNDIPMPLRTMVGIILKETPGMYKMQLHGDIISDRVLTCMKCGKAITNPVSQYFGMGPECGGHNYVNPFESKSALELAVSNYKQQLQNITWEGWIIKSSITSMEEIKKI